VNRSDIKVFLFENEEDAKAKNKLDERTS